MEDLKKYLVVDKDKVKRSLQSNTGLKKLRDISDNVEFWVDFFSYSSERTAMENFLRYKMAAALRLYREGYDDADITGKVLQYFKEKLGNLEEVEKVLSGKEISETEKYRAIKVYLKNKKELFFETDTANSLMSDLNLFMNKVIKNVFNLDSRCFWPDETYIKLYHLEKGRSASYYKPFKLFYYIQILKIVSEKYSEDECWKLLEERAHHIHTLPNMMLVPYGYNAPRGFGLTTYTTNRKISDRLDLTNQDYDEMMGSETFTDEDLQKRLRNNKATKESIEFLQRNKAVLMPAIPVFTAECEKNTLDGIAARSKIIIDTCYKK